MADRKSALENDILLSEIDKAGASLAISIDGFPNSVPTPTAQPMSAKRDI